MYKVQTTESAPQALGTINLEVPSMPEHFIGMDLIGQFKLSLQEYQHALNVRDMLTNYTWYILLYTMEGDEVVHAFLFNILSLTGHTKFCQTVELNLKTHYLHKLHPLWE